MHRLNRVTCIEKSIWKNRMPVVVTFVTKLDCELEAELGSERSRVGSTLSGTEPHVLDAKLDPRTV